MSDDKRDIDVALSSNRTEALKEYYALYLTKIKGLKRSTVQHYFVALNSVSKRLKDKGYVENDVYEILDLDYLKKAQEVLNSDPEFCEQDKRGNRMYSSGLKNYCQFAAGELSQDSIEQITKLDVPLPPESTNFVRRETQKRSNILRTQALAFADWRCELNPDHKSFIAESNRKPFMEGHHLIPLKLQTQFESRLDVYANLICLCPLCHRKIHYGVALEREEMFYQLYESRSKRLSNCGISFGSPNFFQTNVLTISHDEPTFLIGS